MLSICNICLCMGHGRSFKLELQTLEGPLRNFYDELCGAGTDFFDTLFCPKCVYLLRKFYNFRNKCRKANFILKEWKKESLHTKIQQNKLYTKLPPTSLGIRNTPNRTICYYNNKEDYTENISCNDLNILNYDEGVFIEEADIKEKSLSKTFTEINKDDETFTETNEYNETFTETNDNYYVDFEMLDTDTEIDEIKAELDDDHFLVVIANNAEVSKASPDFDDDKTDCDDNVLNNGDINDYQINDVNINEDDNNSDVLNDNDINSDEINDDDINDDQNIYNYTFNSELTKISGKKKRGYSIATLLNKVFEINLTNDEILQIKRAMFSSKEELLTAVKEFKEKHKSEPKHEPEPTKIMTARELDLEKTKADLKRKLENGDVKDKDGNIIEMDDILNNLDKLTKASYTRIKRYCTGDGPLTPHAIYLLSQMQKKYGNRYSSIFIAKHLTTYKEIVEAFKQRETNPSYLQSEHKCTKCYRHFNYAKSLDYHNSQFHDQNKPHKCQFCECTFSDRTRMNQHIRTHKVVYQCKLCPLVTNYECVKENHFNIHTGVRYPCTKCNAVFRSPQCLYAHFNRSHHVVSFICPCCALTFHSKAGLNIHKKRKHRDDLDTVGPPSAKCEQCDIQFISDEVYQDHLRKSHDEPNKNRTRRNRTGSAKTNISTDKSEMVKKRKPLFKTTPKFTCRVCKAVVSSMGALIWHFRSKHPNEDHDRRRMALRAPYRYLCHECGKGFNITTALTDHQNVHTGVRPYACTECPKAFYSNILLKEHMKIHAPPTYQCQLCDKKFHSMANLSNHKRVHAGNRRYACELCGKTFLHQWAVTAHVRGVHLQIRRERKIRN